MSLRVAVQMDPIESIDVGGDSTFFVAMEGQKRGYELFYYQPQMLSYREGRIEARGWPLILRQQSDDYYSLGAQIIVDLLQFDVLLLRQDPPFDMSYITTTHLLERLAGEVLIVNDPFWVRNHPEKLLVLDFLDLMPPTSISRDIQLLRDFRAAHGDVVVKPLFGNGGAGVFLVREDDLNFNALCEMFLQSSREPMIIQKYLADVRGGDRRIILVDGKPIGAINRIPAEHEARSNLHVGGRAEQTSLTERDHDICDRIGPILADHGQIFVGIDVIGEYLTEINVTSPTGLVELERFEHVNGAKLIWDAVERRYSS